GQDLTPAQLANLYFDANPGFNGGAFEYAAIDDEGSIDLTPAVYTLNGPPETNDASGRVDPGNAIALALPTMGGTMATVLTDGIDRDGTVEQYRIDLDSFDPAQGTLYIGDPNGATPGTPITAANNTINADDLANLYFDADDTNFTGVEIEYVAIDNDNHEDPTPGTITLVPATGNLPPNSVDATALIETDNNGDFQPKRLVDDSNNPFLSGSDPTTDPDNDADPTNDVVAYEIVQLPEDGTLTIGVPGAAGTVTIDLAWINAGNTLTPTQLSNLYFDPDPGFDGDTFTYRSIDTNGAKDPSPATVTLQAAPETKQVIENVPIDSTIAIDGIIPSATIPLTGYETPGGNDPDGNVASYEILTLPDPNDGTLYLGDPDDGGTLIEAGDKIPTDRITDLVFVSSTSFNGTSFTYRAIDNDNNADPTPATVFLNAPPDTTSGTGEVDPGGVFR
ncbi:MAG: hypothetical protein HC795_15240, partial [Coleofasciculaceae cyanobacterium RL_1_1]|nr:hypothetical protein [Coleofasciculaceae cyanobacterium RL_1_1]